MAGSLLEPITFIINQSISESTFPTQWKLAEIIPLHKGKGIPKFIPSNYRPISILPVISKIAERVVQKQMLDFLDKTKQLNRNHHAYRRNHSTVTAMIQLMDTLYTATDNKLISTVMTIDESAAFDVVSHQILLRKMKLYNFSDQTIKWMTSYLSLRSQYVSINTKNSRIISTKSGVPQGSVLGPLMYTLYINELPEAIKDNENCTSDKHSENVELFGQNCDKCGEIICYADDASVVHASNSREENQRKLTENLDKVNNFLTENRLVMNREKTTLTEIMISQKRSKIKGTAPTLIVKDKNYEIKTLVAGKYVRLLGGNVSNNLCWTEHLEVGDKAILPRLRQQLGALSML